MNVLTPGQVSLGQLRAIYEAAGEVELASGAYPHIARSARIIAEASQAEAPVYGVNTGFGKLASHKIAPEDTEELQRNLVLSHCCGVGEPLGARTVILMMVLKLISLGHGASGVDESTVRLLEGMISRCVVPVVPVKGSVGASGDLAPLAHMAAVMIGEGEASFEGARLPGAEALARAGLKPVTLGPKEGLALINGTQFSTACALKGLFEGWDALTAAIVVSCLSTDAIMGSTAPLRAEIHSLRGQPGQIEVAAAMREVMAGSEIRESHRDGDTRVQDPYCIRCQPQVTGAALDLMRFSARTLQIEANAVTDNPLVIAETGAILSGGNFHAEPVGFAADQMALALAEVGAISQRRIALMVDPTLSYDLPPFLAADPGLGSGFMIAEVTSAALMPENKHLANPCTTDSTPTSANQEDHVSMAAHGARRLSVMTRNLAHIVGIEALCAAQGIECRAPLKTSEALQGVVARLRADVPTLDRDRVLAADIETSARLIREGVLVSGLDLPRMEGRA